MDRTVLDLVRSKNIDSIQKLNLLLFFHKNPSVRGTSERIAEKLHLGDTRLVETMIEELADEGLIHVAGQHLTLADTPETRKLLQGLAHSYDHPLTRQALLKQIQAGYLNELI